MNNTKRTNVLSSTLRRTDESTLAVAQLPYPATTGVAKRCINTLKGFGHLILFGPAVCALLTSCTTPAAPMKFAGTAPEAEPQTLHAGDVIKIAFPRAPTLDTTQQIRRDGKINLSLAGEVTAENLSPADLEKKLIDLYAPDLVSKEVRVTVVSSAFAVFVTGAVVHPGKLTPERTLTAFEAVMEAGGFDLAKADTKAVTVIRQESGQTKNFTVNLKAVLDGKAGEPFYLKAYDVVYVPEKFSWF